MKSKEEIQVMLDHSINNLLAAHGGRVDVVSEYYENTNRVLVVNMAGGCRGCARAKATMKHIVENSIKTFDPSIVYVEDNTDHTSGSNPYYKE